MRLKSNLHESLNARDARNAMMPATSDCSSQRILLVDDDINVRQMMAVILSDFGYQVDTAGDGEAGWQMLHAENYTSDGYDLLITDNNMPKLSGIGLITKARAAHFNLPIILASGNVPENTKPLRLSGLLYKPFTAEKLLEAVRKALHIAASQGLEH